MSAQFGARSDARKERIMFRIAILIWTILGATLAGVGLTIVLALPSLADQSMKLIPWACLAGFIVAAPLSWLVATQIAGSRGAR
jgi:uncharacterized Tic20 family protein